MAQKQKQLIANPNAKCSVCMKQNESCIVLSHTCMHHACIDCIENKITLPIQNELVKRAKISVDMVQCKA